MSDHAATYREKLADRNVGQGSAIAVGNLPYLDGWITGSRS